MMLNLGCGAVRPRGWINIDGTLNARLARFRRFRKLLGKSGVIGAEQSSSDWSDVRYMNVAKPLPFKNGSVTVVYSSHLLEHLYREDAEQLMRECYRVMKPGGITRHVVPDLDFLIDKYYGTQASQEEEKNGKVPNSEEFIESLLMRSRKSPRHENFIYRIYTAMYDIHSHKWMYDADSLGNMMRRAGFINVERKDLHESRIPGIEEVELSERVNGGAGICLEGERPR